MSTGTKRGSGYVRIRPGRNVWYARFYARGKRYDLPTGVRCDQATEAERAAAKQKAETKLIKMVKDAAAPNYVEPAARKLKLEDLADLARRDAVRK
jgi:hypothetical protein